jgi:uncharacterized protein
MVTVTVRGGVLAAALALGAGLGWAAEAAYEAEQREWRERREQRLRSDDGWLTVAGLYWLEEGANRLGTATDGEVVLPAGSAPERVGVLQKRADAVTLSLEEGVEATVGGQPVAGELEMRPDTSGEPTVLELGTRLRMHVIEREGRLGVRLKDLESEMRKGFEGLSWFPVAGQWRVEARWEPYDPPKTVKIPNVIGYVSDMKSPGAAVFTVGGEEMRLEPVLEGEGATDLFFIFADATNGAGTYPAGRFLYTALPEEGRLVLDFNRAYNPPCAFTPFATCPLPPRQNRLAVRIEAGEKHAGDPAAP